ncbi:hypothetical protein G7Y89_g1074 [Cudoniella acicularis]|uniref:Tyrosinase copper-binding domain-containing protein n=1 Tax=Cudoniella acicularis TaxID=354080 RepID=A0A8H4RXM0_9HELO|nr:hypothetical protein G7Y89_g1074 [Cudoniella acicularis]
MTIGTFTLSKWRYSPLPSSDRNDTEFKQQSESIVRHRKLRISIILLLPPITFVLLAVFWKTIVGLQPTGDEVKTSCSQPSIRREWRSLSRAEKKNYINAVKCLGRTPSRLTPNGTLYDDFPWAHAQVSGGTHGSAAFYPWHRYFIHVYEKSLKEDCEYNGNLPYWDWTLDWEKITKAPVWDSENGFGGDGNSTGEIVLGHGRCVVDGPFAGQTALFYGTRYDPHCLSRGFGDGINDKGVFSGAGVRPEVVEKIMRQPDYEKFFLAVENGPHSTIPNGVRGDFFSFTAPYDPVFFLHHAQLDRLWWLWQQKLPRERLLAYHGKRAHHSTEKAQLTDALRMFGLAEDKPVSQVMSTHSNLLCYSY